MCQQIQSKLINNQELFKANLQYNCQTYYDFVQLEIGWTWKHRKKWSVIDNYFAQYPGNLVTREAGDLPCPQTRASTHEQPPTNILWILDPVKMASKEFSSTQRIITRERAPNSRLLWNWTHKPSCLASKFPITNWWTNIPMPWTKQELFVPHENCVEACSAIWNA